MARPLRDLIAENSPLIVPSMYDGISALLIKELGFESAYIGSYATGATRYGVPDIGYIGLEDMADQVRRLGAIADVAIIVDGEGGWGNPLHVARAVQVLERAGAAATHIEDHDFGKHLTLQSRVLSVDAAADKIKAAVDGRRSDDFQIIARTDAIGVEGPDRAVDRVLAYEAAGADGLFIAGFLDEAAWTRLKNESKVPIYVPDFPHQSAAEQGAQGADVVLYYGLAHIAAKAGMQRALETLKRESSALSLAGELDVRGFDDFLGIGDAREQSRRFGLIPADDDSVAEMERQYAALMAKQEATS